MIMIAIICSPDSLTRNKNFAQTLSATKSAENLSAPAQHQVELVFFCRAGFLINWPKNFFDKVVIEIGNHSSAMILLLKGSPARIIAEPPSADGPRNEQKSHLQPGFPSTEFFVKFRVSENHEGNFIWKKFGMFWKLQTTKMHSCRKQSSEQLICWQSWFGLLRNWQ